MRYWLHRIRAHPSNFYYKLETKSDGTSLLVASEQSARQAHFAHQDHLKIHFCLSLLMILEVFVSLDTAHCLIKSAASLKVAGCA